MNIMIKGGQEKQDMCALLPLGKHTISAVLNISGPHGEGGTVHRWFAKKAMPIPDWFQGYCDEVHEFGPTAIADLKRRGFVGPWYQEGKNEAYHVLAHIEALIINRTLDSLRASRLGFSHGIVNDALVIHNSVNATDVHTAFLVIATDLGFPNLTFRSSSWENALNDFDQLLTRGGYTALARIPQMPHNEMPANAFSHSPDMYGSGWVSHIAHKKDYFI
jgi:hypothetical protein